MIHAFSLKTIFFATKGQNLSVCFLAHGSEATGRFLCYIGKLSKGLVASF